MNILLKTSVLLEQYKCFTENTEHFMFNLPNYGFEFFIVNVI